jgi:transposase
MEEEFKRYVGIDWGSQKHQACVLDPRRQVISEQAIEHRAEAMHEFIGSLLRPGVEPGQVAVGIEVPRGALVETLLERGFAVFFITPKQLDRFRDRHSVAGAKDDRRDAFVLADSLSTDRHCFRPARVDHPLVIQIRQVSRADSDLKQEVRRLSNQLREQIYRYFPQLLRLSPAADDPWLWDFLELAPTPRAAARLGTRRIQAFLRAHRLRKISTEAFTKEVESASFEVAPGTVEAAVLQIQLLIPRLRLVATHRDECEKRLEKLFAMLAAEDPTPSSDQHRKIEVLRSLPGVGNRVAGSLVAEAWQLLTESDHSALRLLTGVAPVTRASGKQRSVIMRYACNDHLRNAVYYWSRAAVRNDDHCLKAYAELRARGHSHGRALRSVADRLLAVACAMLRSGTLFDPNRRRGTKAVTSAT